MVQHQIRRRARPVVSPGGAVGVPLPCVRVVTASLVLRRPALRTEEKERSSVVWRNPPDANYRLFWHASETSVSVVTWFPYLWPQLRRRRRQRWILYLCPGHEHCPSPARCPSRCPLPPGHPQLWPHNHHHVMHVFKGFISKIDHRLFRALGLFLPNKQL